MSRGQGKSEQQPWKWSDLSLPVTDLGDGVEFYRESMELETEHVGDGFAFLVHPETGHRLSMKKCAAITEPPIGIEADDFSVQHERRVARGTEVLGREENATFERPTVADRDGHEIPVWWEAGGR